MLSWTIGKWKKYHLKLPKKYKVDLRKNLIKHVKDLYIESYNTLKSLINGVMLYSEIENFNIVMM